MNLKDRLEKKKEKCCGLNHLLKEFKQLVPYLAKNI